MNTLTVDLFKARDATDAYAIAAAGEGKGKWRAVTGFGSDFEKEWTVEFQSVHEVHLASLDWNSILGRAIEAAEMSDPVITDYEWPVGATS